jgi:hypothetical protein
MPRAPHLEAQLQAVKDALSQKNDTVDKVNDKRPSTSTYTGDKYSLTTVDNVPDTYKFYRKMALRPLPQDEDPQRYTDNEWPGLPRDPEDKSDLLWVRGEDVPDMREPDGSLSYRHAQPFMLFWTGPEISEKVSELCTSVLRFDEQTGTPVYDKDKVCPINIKPGDDYLGACWLHLKEDLSKLFPADVHPNGEPYHDRPPYGLPFRPRAAYEDFPIRGGYKFDPRIGYIRCKNGGIIILGGETFNAQKDLKDTVVRNWHHHYIDISDRDASKLVPVLDEPMEIARRPKILLPTLRPTGALSAWEPPKQRLVDEANAVLANKPLSKGDILKILSHIPVRGYNPDIPSYELLSHAALSGAMYAEAFESSNFKAAKSHASFQNIVQALDTVIDTIVGFATDDEETDSQLTSLGQRLAEVQRKLAAQISIDSAYKEEVIRAMTDIPPAQLIMKALPPSIIPLEHRTLTNAMAEAIRTITHETSRELVMCVQPRYDWNQLSRDRDEYVPEDLLPFPQPYKTAKDTKPSDEKIQDLFKCLDSSTSDTAKKRKKSDKEGDSADTDKAKKGKNNKIKSDQGPVTHDTHYWKFKSVMKTQNNAREAVKIFKVHPRRNKRDEMIADVEAKVNADRKGLTPDGLRFGSMLPKKI